MDRVIGSRAWRSYVLCSDPRSIGPSAVPFSIAPASLQCPWSGDDSNVGGDSCHYCSVAHAECRMRAGGEAVCAADWQPRLQHQNRSTQEPARRHCLDRRGSAFARFRVTEEKDAGYKAVDTAFKRHIQAVRREGEGTISFVYYSGHGAADPDTKINYLIPVDVASADDESLWINSLNLNNVIENLRELAPAATHYVVFDASSVKLTAGTECCSRCLYSADRIRWPNPHCQGTCWRCAK